MEDAAARRLRDALDRIASDTIEECPVCLEQPTASDARVLRCCQAIMCRRCIPSCKHPINGYTCPFCRNPFESQADLEGMPEEDQGNESPFTYTTKDYSAHREFVASVDYTVSRSDWYAESGRAASSGSVQDYSAVNDYSATTSSGQGAYSTKDYSAGHTQFTATDYSSSTDYSCSSSYTTKDYSISGDKYSSSKDYGAGDIASKYSGSGGK